MTGTDSAVNLKENFAEVLKSTDILLNADFLSEVFGGEPIAAQIAQDGEKIYLRLTAYGNLLGRTQADKEIAAAKNALLGEIESVLSGRLGLKKDVDYRLNPELPSVLLGVIYGDAYLHRCEIGGTRMIAVILQLVK